jgi:hypothetical protein
VMTLAALEETEERMEAKEEAAAVLMDVEELSVPVADEAKSLVVVEEALGLAITAVATNKVTRANERF